LAEEATGQERIERINALIRGVGLALDLDDERAKAAAREFFAEAFRLRERIWQESVGGASGAKPDTQGIHLHQ